MSGSAWAFQWLVWVIILAIGVQFFLAGLGVMGGESIDPHRALGMLFQLLTLVLVILAFVSKQPSEIRGMTVVLLVLAILQTVFIIDDLDQLRAFHVFDAFLITALVMHLGQRVGFPLRSSGAA
jgi:hypothetical protein